MPAKIMFSEQKLHELKLAIEVEGLSRVQAAKRFGVSKPVIQRWARKHNLLSPEARRIEGFHELDKQGLLKEKLRYVLEEEGFSHTQAAKRFNVSKDIISQRARKFNLLTPRAKRMKEQREHEKQGLRSCASCKEIQPLNNYTPISGGYLNSNCKRCVNDYILEWGQTSIDHRMRIHLPHTKAQAKRRGIKFDLKHEDIIQLWGNQDHRCFFTGELMTCRSNQRNTVSIDRLDSSKGYAKENVVLCCNVVNLMKQNLSVEELQSWCKKILAHLGGARDVRPLS